MLPCSSWAALRCILPPGTNCRARQSALCFTRHGAVSTKLADQHRESTMATEPKEQTPQTPIAVQAMGKAAAGAVDKLTEAGLSVADQLTKRIAELQRVMPDMDALTTAHRRNMEALSAAYRASLEGAQAVAR